MAQRSSRPHPMETIANNGAKPVGKQPLPSGKPGKALTMQTVVDATPGLQAKGLQLVDAIIDTVKEHSVSWTDHYKTLLTLSPESRKAFQDGIRAATSRPRGEIGFMDAKGNLIPHSDKWAEATRRSARSRLSEFGRIAKALDAGVKFDPEWAFFTATGYASTALQSAGQGSTRGRKATPVAEKVKAYLVDRITKDHMSAEDIEAILVEVMAEIEAKQDDKVEAATKAIKASVRKVKAK